VNARGEVVFGCADEELCRLARASKENSKDLQGRSRKFFVSAVLPVAKDLLCCVATAAGNISMYAPSACQPDLHHLVTEAAKLGAPSPTTHIKTMAHLTPVNVANLPGAKYQCFAAADILVKLPTPVEERKIMASISSCAERCQYATFPPLRFTPGETNGSAASPRSDSAARRHESVPVFGEPPRTTSIHCIVGEVAASGHFWTAKLCEVIRDMEYMGFEEKDFDGGMLPVLILNGTAKAWIEAKDEMANFFPHVPEDLKYPKYLKNHLIVLHDVAASHPTNVLADLIPRITMVENAVNKWAKKVKAEKAETEAQVARIKADMEAEVARIKADMEAEVARIKADMARIKAETAETKAQVARLKTAAAERCKEPVARQ
jgi:hypothetical protein